MEAREGKLTLHFEEEPFADNAAGKASVMLDNRSKQSVRVHVSCLVSDVLIPVASLLEEDPADEVWHVYSQHNPEALPPNYELSVASAHFFTPGSASLTGKVSLAPGIYDSALFLMGWLGDPRHARARVDVRIGDTELLAPMDGSHESAPLWQWLPGSPLHVTNSEVLPVQVTAEALESPLPNYADLGYIALIRTRDGAAEYFAGAAALPGDVTIGPFATESWTLDLEQHARLDVWAWELGQGGKVYHIFAVRPASR